ncbi:MAG: bac 5 protein [Chloroflexota bacterium]|nr:bac 5 protein [Chloroflexota bacterium]
MTSFPGKWSFPAFAVLAAVILSIAGCSARQPQATEKPIEKIVTVEVTVLVAQTRVVVETREVAKTVVVTATPIPTPTYVSAINAPADTLVYPLPGAPVTLSPQEATDPTSALVVQQLYEGLYNLRADGSTVPAGATGYQVSADGKVYTITLRNEAKWSDGQPVTAQHFVDGVCLTLDPATGNDYYYLLTDIAAITGAQAFASGNTADCGKVGVKAAGERVLQIALDRPASFFPKLLAMQVFLPARKELTHTVAGGLVNNGPYALAEHTPGQRLVLQASPTYWNAGQVRLQRIEFRIVPNLADQLAQYKRGDLVAAEFPGDATAAVMADAVLAQELRILVRPGVSYIGLNTQAGPTKNVAFRKAIASAIDRQKLIEETLKQGWHVAAQAAVPPDIPGSQAADPAVGYPYDPAAAQKFLAEAGYGPDKPVPPVEIWINQEGNNELIFKAVAEMLEQVGIPTRLTTSKWAVYREALDACNKPNHASAAKTPAECPHNLYRMGWVMDYADPSALLDMVFSPRSAFQYTGWQSKKYDELLAQALAERDEAKRIALYQAAERVLLNEEAVIVPLQFYDRTLLVKDGVQFDFPQLGPPNLQFWQRTR